MSVHRRPGWQGQDHLLRTPTQVLGDVQPRDAPADHHDPLPSRVVRLHTPVLRAVELFPREAVDPRVPGPGIA